VAHAMLLTSSPDEEAWLQMQKNDKCEIKNKKNAKMPAAAIWRYTAKRLKK